MELGWHFPFRSFTLNRGSLTGLFSIKIRTSTPSAPSLLSLLDQLHLCKGVPRLKSWARSPLKCRSSETTPIFQRIFDSATQLNPTTLATVLLQDFSRLESTPVFLPYYFSFDCRIAYSLEAASFSSATSSRWPQFFRLSSHGSSYFL